MLCIPIIGPTLENAKSQIKRASCLGDLLEFRLDCIKSWDVSEIKQLLQKAALPTILTLRKKSQGGFYPGTESERLSTIQQLAKLEPDFLDLEYDIPKAFFQEIMKEHPHLKIIVSFHDFEKTPKDLEGILTTLKKTPGHFYKIVTTAHSSLDALRMLGFVKKHRNLIGLCMGEAGIPTRILGPVVGSYCVFAPLYKIGTLPTVDELLNIYHFKSLNKDTRMYALIGDPVDSSIGHLMHNAVLRDLRAVYVKFKVGPNELREFLLLAQELDIKGLSVTMPLKEMIVPYLDVMEEAACNIGSVNTVSFEHGRSLGYNTDAAGALDAIEAKGQIKGKKVIVLGAGGAARAIVYEACKRGAKTVILNRTKTKALKLAERFGSRGGGLENLAEESKGGYDVLINTTPEDLSLDPEWILPNTLVMDIRTHPKNSSFLQKALEKGCTPIYGHEMFINQAISQLEIWFKNQIDRNKIKP